MIFKFLCIENNKIVTLDFKNEEQLIGDSFEFDETKLL